MFKSVTEPGAIEHLRKKIDQSILRPWQERAIEKSLAKIITDGETIIPAEAVTGGGKTYFGVILAAKLLELGRASRIVTLAPSVEIRDGWCSDISALGLSASCELKAIGDVVAFSSTYQTASGDASKGGTENGARALLKLVDKNTVLVVDECHHPERMEGWGVAVEELSKRAGYTIALTGTPWKTTGTVALLDRFYDEDGKLDIDIRYTYMEDLAAEGDDRATVPAHFIYFDSISVCKADKSRTEFVAPTSGDDESWQALADKDSTEPLTPHVQVKDGTLASNSMARKMLAAGINKLDLCKGRTKQKAIGLVVAKSINEARSICDYLVEEDEVATVIVSDDDTSAKTLADIRNGKVKTDWIVSVGMVSEGVDIPAIKVIVYLSGITTLLFLIQVIGRALRRINKNKKGEKPSYIDNQLEDTPAYILMPAHPVLLHVGWEIEKDIRQAKQDRKDKGKGDGGEREFKEYENIGGNNVAMMRRNVPLPETVDRMLTAIEADLDGKKICTAAYRKWIYDLVEDGEAEYVKQELEDKIKRFGIEIETGEFSKALTYDQQTRALKKAAVRLTNSLRFGHPNYKSIRDDQEAFRRVRRDINKLAGISDGFARSTIADKERWVEEARRRFMEIQYG